MPPQASTPVAGKAQRLPSMTPLGTSTDLHSCAMADSIRIAGLPDVGHWSTRREGTAILVNWWSFGAVSEWERCLGVTYDFRDGWAVDWLEVRRFLLETEEKILRWLGVGWFGLVGRLWVLHIYVIVTAASLTLDALFC